MSRPDDPYGYQAQEIYDKLAADSADAAARGELEEEPTQEEIAAVLREMDEGNVAVFPGGAIVFRNLEGWEVTMPEQEPGEQEPDASGGRPQTAEDTFRAFLRGELCRDLLRSKARS